MPSSTSSSVRQAPARASRIAAACLACVAWSGVLLQLWLSLQLARSNGRSLADGFVAYFGYFTVLTNILVALVLTAAAGSNTDRRRGLLSDPQVVACVAAGIAVVGMGYHLLLRHVWDPQGLQLVADVLLHYVMPISYCAFWLIFMPRVALPWWSPVAWCAYPVGYFSYALVRGAFVGSYPYPFIDVASIGYGRATLNALGLLAAFLAIGWILLALQRLPGRPRPAPAAQAN